MNSMTTPITAARFEATDVIIDINSQRKFYSFIHKMMWLEREVKHGNLFVCPDAGSRCLIGAQVDRVVRLDVELLLRPTGKPV